MILRPVGNERATGEQDDQRAHEERDGQLIIRRSLACGWVTAAFSTSGPHILRASGGLNSPLGRTIRTSAITK